MVNPQKHSARSSIYRHVFLKNLLPLIDDDEQQTVFRCVLSDLQSAFPTDPWARLSLKYALLSDNWKGNFVRTLIEQSTQEQRRELYQTILPIASEGYLSIPQEYQNDSDIREKFNKYNAHVPLLLLENLSAILQRELVDGDTEWVLAQMSHLNDLNKNILSTPYDPTKPKRVPFNRIFSHFASSFYASEQDQTKIVAVTRRLFSIARDSYGLRVLRTIIQADCVPLTDRQEALDHLLELYDYNLAFSYQIKNDPLNNSNCGFGDIFLQIAQNNNTPDVLRSRMFDFLRSLSQQRFDNCQHTIDYVQAAYTSQSLDPFVQVVKTFLTRRVERSYFDQFLSEHQSLSTIDISTIKEKVAHITQYFVSQLNTFISQHHLPFNFDRKIFSDFIDFFSSQADSAITTEQLISNFFNFYSSAQ